MAMPPALRWLASALQAVALAGCAAPAPPPPTTGDWQDFRVLTRGADAGGDFCADFDLTADQARLFFARAEPLNATQLHDRYERLPCWVRGTARGSQGVVSWEVRAGGTARAVAPDGTVTLLGCQRCDELLGGRAPPAPSR